METEPAAPSPRTAVHPLAFRSFVLTLGLAALLLTPLGANMPEPLLDLISNSPVIVLAKTVRTAADQADVELAKVYKGEEFLPQPQGHPRVVTVSSKRAGASNPDNPFLRPWRLGAEAVLFLQRPPPGRTAFELAWQTPWTLEPATRDADLTAIEHHLEVCALPDERQRLERWLKDLDVPNPRLARAARELLVTTAIRSPRPADYTDIFLELLGREDRGQMSLGLTCLQNLKADAAVPRLIALTHDPEESIAKRAGMALAHYPGNAAAAQALIALTRHADPQVRSQSMMSLDKYDCPEVTAALQERLQDPDPEVRRLVPRAFHYKSEETRAALNPKLFELLGSDPSPKVQAAAASALGQQVPVERLLGYLGQKDLDAEMRVAVLGSLYAILGNSADKGAAVVRQNEELFVAQVMRAEHHMIGFNALCILDLVGTPKGKAVTEKAAVEHPLEYVRDLARYLVKKRQEAKAPAQ